MAENAELPVHVTTAGEPISIAPEQSVSIPGPIAELGPLSVVVMSCVAEMAYVPTTVPPPHVVDHCPLLKIMVPLASGTTQSQWPFMLIDAENVKLTEQSAITAPVVYVVPLHDPTGHVPPTVESVT